MLVEESYFRFLTDNVMGRGNEADYPTRESVRQAWDDVETMVLNYVARVDDTELHREIRRHENAPTIFVWQAMMQVINHSTDHRAQTLAGLHRLGAPTVAQDYVYFVIEQKAT